jgi:hypothetical protein
VSAKTTATKAQAAAVVGALVTAFQAYSSLKHGATVGDYVTPGLTFLGTVLTTFVVYWLPNLRKDVARYADDVRHYADDVATVAGRVADEAEAVSDGLSTDPGPAYDAAPAPAEPTPLPDETPTVVGMAPVPAKPGPVAAR